MTLAEARQAILKQYLATFDGVFPIAVDNKRFTDTEETWVRVTIKADGGFQSSLGISGNRRYLRTGTIYVQVFTMMNKGTDLNDQYAEESLNVLDGYNIDGLWTYNGRIQTVGSDSEYYQQNVVIDFEFENIR
jgi:hypothetical protein